MAIISQWMAENLWMVPVAFVILYFGFKSEVKRLDKRLDATITLLKQHGVDIYDDPAGF